MTIDGQGSAEGTVTRSANFRWVDLGHGIRLQLEQHEDGWCWRAWERMTTTRWQALPAPAIEDVAARFSTSSRAGTFFQRLALLLLRHTGHGEG